MQIGAYKQRDGALDMQQRLIEEQPWIAPLLAVIDERGLNKLQAGPYQSRDEGPGVSPNGFAKHSNWCRRSSTSAERACRPAPDQRA